MFRKSRAVSVQVKSGKTCMYWEWHSGINQKWWGEAFTKIVWRGLLRTLECFQTENSQSSNKREDTVQKTQWSHWQIPSIICRTAVGRNTEWRMLLFEKESTITPLWTILRLNRKCWFQDTENCSVLVTNLHSGSIYIHCRWRIHLDEEVHLERKRTENLLCIAACHNSPKQILKYIFVVVHVWNMGAPVN